MARKKEEPVSNNAKILANHHPGIPDIRAVGHHLLYRNPDLSSKRSTGNFLRPNSLRYRGPTPGNPAKRYQPSNPLPYPTTHQQQHAPGRQPLLLRQRQHQQPSNRRPSPLHKNGASSGPFGNGPTTPARTTCSSESPPQIHLTWMTANWSSGPRSSTGNQTAWNTGPGPQPSLT